MTNYEQLSQEINLMLEEIEDLHIVDSSLEDINDFEPINLPL